MNTLNNIARSFNRKQSKMDLREDQVLSRRNYYSHPIPVKEPETVEEIPVGVDKKGSSIHGDIYSMYSDNTSDEIKYPMSIAESKATRGTVNDIFDSYQDTHVTVCCNNKLSLKMMFLECGHFVHTKCKSDMLLVGNSVCPRCAYQIKDDEIKCILIKSTTEYNTEKDRLEKQKVSMTRIINEYQLALSQCLDSLEQIKKTSDDLERLFQNSFVRSAHSQSDKNE